MSASDRLFEAVKEARRNGRLDSHTKPLDLHNFYIQWLLQEIDRLDSENDSRGDDGK